jgi:hypothetical protein
MTIADCDRRSDSLKPDSLKPDSLKHCVAKVSGWQDFSGKFYQEITIRIFGEGREYCRSQPLASLS